MQHPKFILILLVVFLFACDSEEKEKTQTPNKADKKLFQMICQEWQLADMSFDEVPVPKEKYAEAFYHFHADSSYQISYPSYQDTGKWELGSDQKSILFISQNEAQEKLHPHSIVRVTRKELELIRYESEPMFGFDEGMKTLKLQAK